MDRTLKWWQGVELYRLLYNPQTEVVREILDILMKEVSMQEKLKEAWEKVIEPRL